MMKVLAPVCDEMKEFLEYLFLKRMQGSKILYGELLTKQFIEKAKTRLNKN